MSTTVDLKDYKTLKITQAKISSRVNVAQSYVCNLYKASRNNTKTVKLSLHDDGSLELVEHRRIGERG
ncbi:MAG: hypothetical protein MJA28_06305 [Gammaproteobacteria bacterium]|nr:hypothetical protein [Gammaproteobacteria bacterium]